MIRSFARASVSLLAVALASAPALGQTAPTEVELLTKQKELVNAQTELMKAQTARIEALPLPEFEGKTTLGTNGGAMESHVMTAQALGQAADKIAEGLRTGLTADTAVLLTGTEKFDIGLMLAMRREMDALADLFAKAGYGETKLGMAGGGIGFAGALSAVSQVAGLLRSETTLTYTDTPAVDDKMLTWAVAQRLTKPGTTVILPDTVHGFGVEGGKILDHFAELEDRNREAVDARDKLRKKKTKTKIEKDQLARLETVTARFATLSAAAVKPGTDGVTPLIAAARLANIYGADRPIVRLEIDEAGGSMVNSKNIFTHFGADPLKVSGGLLISYLATMPDDGKILAADVLTCTTDFVSIRRVQRRQWRSGQAEVPVCRSVLPPTPTS